MVLEVDNKGANDLINNWSVGGRTRHIEVKQYFLRELKEAGIIVTKWRSGDDMTSDLFTKNLAGPLFEKHGQVFFGKDEYVTREGRVLDGDDVGRESNESNESNMSVRWADKV